MPVSGSLKDRLRVFESPQKDTVATEPNPKRATPSPKPRSVADRYLQNTHGESEHIIQEALVISKSAPKKEATPTKYGSLVGRYTPVANRFSPSWAKPNLRRTPTRQVIESRESIEEQRRSDSPGAIDRDFSDGREILEPVKTQPSVTGSPRKPISAYEALIREKNDKISSNFNKPVVSMLSPSSIKVGRSSPTETTMVATPSRQVVTSDKPIVTTPSPANEKLPKFSPSRLNAIASPYQKHGKTENLLLSTQSEGTLTSSSGTPEVGSPLRKVVTSPLSSSPRVDGQKTTSSLIKESKKTPIAKTKGLSVAVSSTRRETVTISNTLQSVKMRAASNYRRHSPRTHISPNESRYTEQSHFHSTISPKKLREISFMKSNKLSVAQEENMPLEDRKILSRGTPYPDNVHLSGTEKELQYSLDGKSQLPSPRFSLSPASKCRTPSSSHSGKTERDGEMNYCSMVFNDSLSMHSSKTTNLPSPRFSLSPLKQQAISMLEKVKNPQDDQTQENTKSSDQKREVHTSSPIMFPLFPGTPQHTRVVGKTPVSSAEKRGRQEEYSVDATSSAVLSKSTGSPKDQPSSNSSKRARKSHSRLLEMRERSPTLFKAFHSARAIQPKEKPETISKSSINTGKEDFQGLDPLLQMKAYNRSRSNLDKSSCHTASKDSVAVLLDSAGYPVLPIASASESRAGNEDQAKQKTTQDQILENQNVSQRTAEGDKELKDDGARKSRAERYATILKQKGRAIAVKRKSPRLVNKMRRISETKRTDNKKFFGSQKPSIQVLHSTVSSSSTKDLEDSNREDTVIAASKDSRSEECLEKNITTLTQKKDSHLSLHITPFQKQFGAKCSTPSGKHTSTSNYVFVKSSNCIEEVKEPTEATSNGNVLNVLPVDFQEDDYAQKVEMPQQFIVTKDPDVEHIPSIGSLTVEEEDMVIFSPLMENSPGKNIDSGDSKPHSLLTPSNFENVRSIFENASKKNEPSVNTRRPVEENSTKRDAWTPRNWAHISVEEKVMSSMERLYNTHAPLENQTKIQGAMNPFSLSTDYGSGSFPSTFDETLLETKSLQEDAPQDISECPADEPSLLSSAVGAEINTSSSIGQCNSMLHGEFLAEDGSGLQYSSGSQHLKMSRSSATGNFLSSSSSQLSKSTISREELLLKAGTRSTVSSPGTERLAPILDVNKEEESPVVVHDSKETESENESESKYIAKPTSMTSDGVSGPSSKSDALRWWQRKYARNVADATNNVVKKVFKKKNNKDDEDVFSGLEEEAKGDGHSSKSSLNGGEISETLKDGTVENTCSATSLVGFDSVIPPPPPPPPPPSVQAERKESRTGTRLLGDKKDSTTDEVTKFESSNDAKPAVIANHTSHANSQGMVVNGKKQENSTFKIIQPPTTEERVRRKFFTKNDRFGPIEEIHQTPHIDSHKESTEDSTSHIDSQVDSSSRMTSQIASSRFDSQIDYPMDSNIDSNSRLDSQMISESDSLDKRDPHARSESEDDTREYLDADSADISYAESKETKAQSAFEFTAATVLGLGYTILTTITKTLELSGKSDTVGLIIIIPIPHNAAFSHHCILSLSLDIPSCTDDAGNSCVKRADDCAYMMGLDEATESSSRNATNRESLSPIMVLNEEEQKRWDIWEERDELSGRKKKNKRKEISKEKTEQSVEATSSSSYNSAANRLRRREEAQSKLLEHAKNAQSLDREATDESILPAKTEDTDAISGDERSVTTRSVYVQQHILEKFSSMLRNEKVEILKLNRHGKWQVRFITVSKEVSWLKNKKATATPKSSQFPQALLWYKTHSTKNNGLADLKNDGRGGFLFSQLRKVERDPNVSPPAPIPRKLKGRYGKYAGVRIHYVCEEGDRELIFGFQDPMDATAFCTAINILRQVVHRNEDDVQS